MTGASDAADELRSAVLVRYDALRHAVSQVSSAVLALRGAGDLMEVLREADRLSLACEALGDLATDMHKSADQTLCRIMEESGAPAFRSAHHTVSTRRTPATVDIADESAVPEEFLSVPRPRPDRARIREYLQANPDGVNWASLGDERKSVLQRRPYK